MMGMMTFNTLETALKLQEAGFTEKQATVAVRAMVEVQSQLVTKEDLKTGLGEVRSEVQTVKEDLKAEIREVRIEIQEVKNSLKAEIQEVRVEVQGVKEDIKLMKKEFILLEYRLLIKLSAVMTVVGGAVAGVVIFVLRLPH